MKLIPEDVPVTLDYNSLRQLDLNLLLALDILVKEASVTQAAEKLNMSQSSMSHALKRLRSVLNDPILIRTSQRHMEVTPYAREISFKVRQVLTDIQETLLAKNTFNPETAQEDFRIATNDYVEATLTVNLLRVLTQQAPNIRIRIDGIRKDAVPAALDDNSLDLFIGADLELKRWHLKEDLYQEKKPEIQSRLARQAYRKQIALWIDRQRQKSFIHYAGQRSIPGRPKGKK
ncbi:MAG: LysR family transcriptional regulator [Cyanobacteria bacterium P01_F01_bin.53]